MRIAYIGNFVPEYSTENDVRKAFEHLGHKVIKIQENQTNPPEVWFFASQADMLLITSTWDNALDLSQMIDVFHACADKGIPTVTLHLDTFWGKSRNDRKWWLNPMFHTAFIFTADGDYQDKWKLFGKRHNWLMPALRRDATYHGKPREEYKCDVAFVGSNGHGYHEDVWMYRTELVDNLRKICSRNGWSFKNPGGDDPKVNRDGDLNDFYASAGVIVGDSLCLKKEISKYWSDRVPETLGRGGKLIMPQINKLDNVYSGRLPMYKWGDWDDLEAKIYLVLTNSSQIKKDYKYMFNKTKQYHTYVNRVQTILKAIK